MIGATIGAPDPDFFAVMSGRPSTGRGRINPDIEPYATPGLPEDATDYAKGLLVEPIGTGKYLKKSAMESPGHFILSDLAEMAKKGRQNIGPGESLSGNAPAEDYLARLYVRLKIIAGEDQTAVLRRTDLADQEILIGSITETLSGTVTHDGMDEMSQHTRLRLKKRLSELAPCTDENLRMLFAYSF